MRPSQVTTEQPNARFAKNLRKLRVEARLSQEGLANAAGLHRTEISLIERGVRDVRLSTVVRLARGLRVEPAELLAGID